jgi:hypothetical protein
MPISNDKSAFWGISEVAFQEDQDLCRPAPRRGTHAWRFSITWGTYWTNIVSTLLAYVSSIVKAAGGVLLVLPAARH